MSARALVVGCGFVGRAFARRLLARGMAVIGTCRTAARAAELARDGVEPLVWTGGPDAPSAAASALAAVAAAADIVLASAPPDDQGDPAFRQLAAVLDARPPAWTGYLSTTGIYGDRGGGWAFESDPPTPASREAGRRALAESQWQGLARPAHLFRLPGIYGPGRSAIDQVRAGTARRIDRPGQVFSRAHRDDIAAALLASLDRPNPGRAYNVCDDWPCPQPEPLAGAAALLGVAPPPLVPFAEAALTEAGRRFWSECKRVSNARIKAETGWRPIFPTWREGLVDCLERSAPPVAAGAPA